MRRQGQRCGICGEHCGSEIKVTAYDDQGRSMTRFEHEACNEKAGPSITKRLFDEFASVERGERNGHSQESDGGMNIQPLDDRALIQRIEEPSGIMLTDAPKGIKGVVLSCGPGKWHPGEWWYKQIGSGINKGKINRTFDWVWYEGWREQMEVKPGDTVLFNSKWNDFSHAENKGSGTDGKGPLERPLSYQQDNTLHLVREADILCKIPSLDISAKLGKPTLEQEFFVNKRVAGPWSEA